MRLVPLSALAPALFLAAPALAQQQIVDRALDDYVLPGFEMLAAETSELAAVAAEDCAPGSETLRAAYGTAFDAWIGVSHLRFGPLEAENRAFALAFWPDRNGATPGSLGQLLSEEDPVIETAESYATVSVAARGFYAMEFLLYDEAVSAAAEGAYGCALIQAVAADIAATSADALADWQESHAELMRSAGSNQTYQSTNEALRALYGSFVEGMEFTRDLRLGRPLGTFDRPRPRRAEVRRSERSQRHVELALETLAELAALLSDVDAADSDRIAAAFEDALTRVRALDDPAFAGVDNPGGRLRVEALMQSVEQAMQTAQNQIGPALGVAAGFNSLDGD
ncbi:MAG: imelysin family protein [Pseudomonadota bacterium]